MIIIIIIISIQYKVVRVIIYIQPNNYKMNQVILCMYIYLYIVVESNVSCGGSMETPYEDKSTSHTKNK